MNRCMCGRYGMRSRCDIRGMRGLGMVELMVATALGLTLALVATALFMSARSGYAFQKDDARVQDTGRIAMEVLSRAVRQAGWLNLAQKDAGHANVASRLPDVLGFDARGLTASSSALLTALSTAQAVNGSDVLLLRYAGSGEGTSGDGSTVNCAGFGVGEPLDLDLDRGWSVFYVALDSSSGEPELRCKYQGTSAAGNQSWKSDAIVSGIEVFQLLYGLDNDGDGRADRFVNASAVRALDDAQGTGQPDAATATSDSKRRSNWNKVVAIRVALLVRGENADAGSAQAGSAQAGSAQAGSAQVGSAPGSSAAQKEYHLFGEQYTALAGATDEGAHFSAVDASAGRMRRLYSGTIHLRNSASAARNSPA
jgi:type IV pilus assembly protein PilW